ncbi:MAG: GNAT family N-acetyltransferase [Defluviitaleaceae bacterium]|nr:GNAT family N-acetyltransferase [Defluviitaleaceae bacterium]
MKHKIKASYKNVLLRALTVEDLELMRIWRNETQVDFLRKIDTITPEMQQEWFKRDNENIECCTFGIEEVDELNRLVGSVALYNFKDKTAECGRILIGDTAAHGRGIGYLAILLSLYIAFENLGFERVIADVHEENYAAVKNNMKAGFVVCGNHMDENGLKVLEIAVERADFYLKHDFLSEVVISGGEVK